MSMGVITAAGVATFVVVFCIEAWYGYRTVAMAEHGRVARQMASRAGNEMGEEVSR
jgi:hypothetical protein